MTFENYSNELLIKIYHQATFKIENLTESYFDFDNNEWVKIENFEKIKLIKTRKFRNTVNREIIKRSDLENNFEWVKEFFKKHTSLNQNCIFKNSVCIICDRVKGVYEN